MNWRRIGFAAGLILSAGCASPDKARVVIANGDSVYTVTSDSTAFFRNGPQQGNGPDMALAKDTLVTLIRRSFGYSRVKLVSSGQLGYIASEDIKLAPAPLVAAATAPPVESSDRFRRASQQLPDPDLPSLTLEPGQ